MKKERDDLGVQNKQFLSQNQQKDDTIIGLNKKINAQQEQIKQLEGLKEEIMTSIRTGVDNLYNAPRLKIKVS